MISKEEVYWLRISSSMVAFCQSQHISGSILTRVSFAHKPIYVRVVFAFIQGTVLVNVVYAALWAMAQCTLSTLCARLFAIVSRLCPYTCAANK